MTLAIAALLWSPVAGRAADAAPASFWFAGTQLTFDHPQLRSGALAVALDDPGLLRFLRKLNAVVAYQAGAKYIVVTAGDRRSISFAVGDPSVAVDGVPQAAAFGAYTVRASAFVPFIDLARALGVIPVRDGADTVLQPQITNVDVKTDKNVTYVIVHGASTLRFKRRDDAHGDHVSLAFSGTSTLLDRDRQVSGSGLDALTISAEGSVRNPAALLDFATTPGATRVTLATASPNTLEFAFAPAGVALDGTPIPAAGGTVAAVATAPPVSAARMPRVPTSAAPTPAPGPASLATPTPTALTLAPAAISALTTDANGDGFDINLAISGPVTYEWHRLADFRWYVDFKPATLALAPQDTTLDDPAVVSLRLKSFVGPTDQIQTVRLGLTLPSQRAVTLVPTSTGMTISVGNADDASPTVAGSGELIGGQTVAAIPLSPPLAAAADTWKFGGVPSVGNGRLIVIDPGHGGSDAGAVHNGLNEKDLTLDMARRLRTALLSRGWQVKMTRDSDVDVFGPNASARDELQARDDVADLGGARLFISVHVNAFTSSDLNGTTTYYYKSDSTDFARAVHDRLAQVLPTKDDGMHKENFYVIRHATMPAILVETAFVSNPGDAALLRSDAFKNQIAQAIAAGVGDFAKPASNAQAQ